MVHGLAAFEASGPCLQRVWLSLLLQDTIACGLLAGNLSLAQQFHLPGLHCLNGHL